MTRATILMLLSVLAVGCGGEVATYRLAGNLVPDYPQPCGECGIGLVLDGVRTDDGSNARGRFWPTIGEEADFHFRWGVEQVVEVETTEEFVPPGVADATGIRKRIVRVLEEHPLPPSTPFEIYFRTAPPGNYVLSFEREAAGVRIGDVLIQCPDTAQCDALMGIELGEKGFTLELSHAATEGGPLTLNALRFDP